MTQPIDKRRCWIRSRLIREPFSKNLAYKIRDDVILCQSSFLYVFAIGSNEWKHLNIEPLSSKSNFFKRDRIRSIFSRVATFGHANPRQSYIAWNEVMAAATTSPCAELENLSKDSMKSDYKSSHLGKIPIITHCLQHLGASHAIGTSLVQRLKGTVSTVDENLLDILYKTQPSTRKFSAVSNGGRNIRHCVRDGSSLAGHFYAIDSPTRASLRECSEDNTNQVAILAEAFHDDLCRVLGSPHQVCTRFSFLSSTASGLQRPHRDLTKAVHDKTSALIGFFPISRDGMFLQVWDSGLCEGHIVFIAFGTLLILPGDTVHSGGFLSSQDHSRRQNLRGHLYIYPNGDPPEVFLKNTYIDEYDNHLYIKDTDQNVMGKHSKSTSCFNHSLDDFYRHDTLWPSFKHLFGCG